MLNRDRKPSAADIAEWMQKLRVPEGMRIGQRFELAPFQIEALEAIYDNPAGTRRAILSFPRKTGKTALCSLLVLAHLVGPKARANSQIYSTAQSRAQAAIVFDYAAKIVRMSPALQPFVIIRDSIKELYCPSLGSKY